jgi:RNA-directed DNA polymerase
MPGNSVSSPSLDQVIAGRIDPSAIDLQEQATIAAVCRDVVRQKHEQISAHASSGHGRIARKKQNELIRSLAPRLLAAQFALRKINKRRLIHHRRNTVSFNAVWHLAERLARNLNAPSYAIARLKRKHNGFREVCAFEAFDIARQKLVTMSITPFVRPLSSQFALRGGRSAASEALLKALIDALEDAKIIHVDINDFYGSISHGWLEENLPLSAAIIQSVILMHNGHICRWHLGLAHQHDEGTEGMGRWGIPQGSVASPIVAEFVMANVLRGVADLHYGLSYFNYSDNLAILVRGDLDEVAFMERLRGVFQTHPAGPFQIRTVGSFPISRPFPFLGYRFQKIANGSRAFIPERAAFLREMNYERDLLEAETFTKLLKVEHSLRSYCAAFSLWAGAADMQRRLLQVGDRQRRHLRLSVPITP